MLYLDLRRTYIHLFISLIHSTNVYICCEALARLWGYDTEQNLSALMEQIFLASEGGIQKLITYLFCYNCGNFSAIEV